MPNKDVRRTPDKTPDEELKNVAGGASVQHSSVDPPDSSSTGSNSATSFAPVENMEQISGGAVAPNPQSPQAAPDADAQEPTIRIKIPDADLSSDINAAE